ncbi:hypothetical protein QFZ76_008193 [Streptomyces sp. V4I2]|nr:hypothetical protein [Streptomyces sp. V4I2]
MPSRSVRARRRPPATRTGRRPARRTPTRPGGGQGLATRANGSLLYRGLVSIPLDLRIKGWNHVGDPDIARGYVFDAYQGPDTATSKMFAVTTPAGERYEYVHRLNPTRARS